MVRRIGGHITQRVSHLLHHADKPLKHRVPLVLWQRALFRAEQRVSLNRRAHFQRLRCQLRLRRRVLMRTVTAAKRVSACCFATDSKRLHVRKRERLITVGFRLRRRHVRQAHHPRCAGFAQHGHEAAHHFAVPCLVAAVFPDEQQIFGERGAHRAVAFALQAGEQTARELVADNQRPLAHKRKDFARRYRHILPAFSGSARRRQYVFQGQMRFCERFLQRGTRRGRGRPHHITGKHMHEQALEISHIARQQLHIGCHNTHVAMPLRIQYATDNAVELPIGFAALRRGQQQLADAPTTFRTRDCSRSDITFGMRPVNSTSTFAVCLRRALRAHGRTTIGSNLPIATFTHSCQAHAQQAGKRVVFLAGALFAPQLQRCRRGHQLAHGNALVTQPLRRKRTIRPERWQAR